VSKIFSGYLSDAKETQPGTYDVSNSVPFEGHLSETPPYQILYVTKDPNICSNVDVFSGNLSQNYLTIQ